MRLATVAAWVLIGNWIAQGQNPGSLKNVPVPQPSGLNQYVRDQAQLVALGKALFWDMQVGSDGRTACATCHFHAGADHRNQNQLSSSTGSFRANQLLAAADFPFHVLADINDNRSPVTRDTASVAGSAGLFRRLFQDVIPASASDDGLDAADAPAFRLNSVNTRQVTARNTPSVIDAVFNVRNFWDGRASNIFTGFTPFGDSDTGLNALVVANGGLAPERIRMENASLASQAVGPPLNSTEMSYDGRTWPKLGRKMLSLRPLALQTVSPDDSVLGSLANPADRGLLPAVTYLSMTQAAFRPDYWSSADLTDGGFTQAEFNFALFFGLAVQAYESTLVSGDSRFDRFSEGDGGALTRQEQQGLQVFRTTGECNACHAGPEFTAASFTSLRGGRGRQFDPGYFRTGVRPIAEDIGLGGLDSFGQPLSIAQRNGAPSGPAQGTFKTPGLRNVEFTGPYFHNGGQATLSDVVDFYNRGSDFPDGGNLDTDIRRRNLSPADRQALVAFLKALTDDRVRFERAPFDHPELCVSAGHVEAAAQILQLDGSDPRFPLSAVDRWVGIPAVGSSGAAVPLQTFEELLAGAGSDGSRAHTLTDACTIP